MLAVLRLLPVGSLLPISLLPVRSLLSPIVVVTRLLLRVSLVPVGLLGIGLHANCRWSLQKPEVFQHQNPEFCTLCRAQGQYIITA